jgi:hypothetical protein
MNTHVHLVPNFSNLYFASTSFFIMAFELCAEHLALVVATREIAFKVKELPIPKPGLGNTIVRVIAAGVLSYHREVYNEGRQYPSLHRW